MPSAINDLFDSSDDDNGEVRAPKVPTKKTSSLLGDSSEDEKKEQQDSDDEIVVNRKAVDKASNLLGEDSSDDEDSVPKSKSTTVKTSELLGSSSDDESKKKSDAENLFGSDEEEYSEPEKKQPKPKAVESVAKKLPVTKTKTPKAKEPAPMTSDDEHAKEKHLAAIKSKERPPLKTVDMKLPQSHQIPPGYDGILLRLPKFLGINPDAFKVNDYVKPKNPPLQTAVIRCKYEEGSRDLLSNTRLLKWDDGSYQLVVADQVFNAKLIPTSNVFVFEQEQAEISVGEESKRTTVLECNGSVSSKITVMPTSLHSESHAKMSITLLEQYKKEDKIQMLRFDDLKNPDQTMHDLVKREEEEIRKKTKELNSQREREKPSGEIPSRRFSRNAMNKEFIEHDEEEEDYKDFIVNGEEEEDYEEAGEENKNQEQEMSVEENSGAEEDREELPLIKSKKPTSNKRKSSAEVGAPLPEDVLDNLSEDENENIVRQPVKRSKVSSLESDSD